MYSTTLCRPRIKRKREKRKKKSRKKKKGERIEREKEKEKNISITKGRWLGRRGREGGEQRIEKSNQTQIEMNANSSFDSNLIE